MEAVSFYYTRGPGESGPTQRHRYVEVDLRTFTGAAGTVQEHCTHAGDRWWTFNGRRIHTPTNGNGVTDLMALMAMAG